MSLRSLHGPDGTSFGAVNCSCHPNCGASVVLVANHRTKPWATITQFFDIGRFMDDIAIMCDTARGKELSLAQIAMSFVHNHDQTKAPPGGEPDGASRSAHQRRGLTYPACERPGASG